MAEILVATGTWFSDGDRQRRVQIFKDSSWAPLPTPPDERPEAPPPRDAQGFYYFARITVTGNGSTRTILYGSTDGAMTAAAKMVASPIRWAD
ncbi:MAG TPA: hypothetical protein VN685_08165 [Rhizomicrobium sp.]|jgi:hypothetical protein|nr:hypothetical protein [Rhizomicrobium sp.]